jgi:hypothetical protein
MKHALQLVEPFTSREDAQQALDALALQDGYLGGRVLEATPAKPTDRVQAFFVDDTTEEWLPDGMLRVIVPRGLAHTLGIK